MTFDELRFAAGTIGGAKLAAAGAVFVLLFFAERIWRAAKPPHGAARLVRNALLWIIVLIASPLIVAPLTALGANSFLWARPPATMQGAAGVISLAADILILDCWTYWIHRAYHRNRLMWRLHVVHHLDGFLDTTSAVRFHLGEVVLSAALRLAPIGLFAIPFMHVVAFETLLLVATLFHHSNLRIPAQLEARLARVIVTPSIHWVHHHAIAADTNSNYAGVFSIWDRLFGSASVTARRPDMKIGLEGVEDKPAIRLLLMPFMRSGGWR